MTVNKFASPQLSARITGVIDSSSECKQSRDLDGALRMNVGGEYKIN